MLTRILLCGALLTGCAAMASAAEGDEPAERTFRFEYGATLTGLKPGSQVRVWLPVPPDDEFQDIRRLSAKLPGEAQTNREPAYGNEIVYFETQAPQDGRLSFQTPYLITRREVQGLTSGMPAKLTAEQRKRFLAADRKVPIDGKPLELLSGIELPKDPLLLSRVLYECVDEHVRYDKSQPGYGQGDVLWVCDSRFGNCTDFHSLFISLARAKGLPARFEIGFPLPDERGEGTVGGYHCWAYFHTEDKGWVPVDISEADKHPDMKEYYFGNLTENRVTFTTGRDLELVPRQAGEPLNFFVYPYVEVDGQALSKEQIELQFSFADQNR